MLSSRSPTPSYETTEGDQTLAVTPVERSAIRWAATAALVVFILAILLLVIPEGAPLRGEGGSLDDSPFLDGIAFLIALIFGGLGIVYGVRVGKITSPSDVPKMMAEGIRTMAPVLVLFFAWWGLGIPLGPGAPVR